MDVLIGIWAVGIGLLGAGYHIKDDRLGRVGWLVIGIAGIPMILAVTGLQL